VAGPAATNHHYQHQYSKAMLTTNTLDYNYTPSASRGGSRSRPRRAVPAHLDLHYITPFLLAASAPERPERNAEPESELTSVASATHNPRPPVEDILVVGSLSSSVVNPDDTSVSLPSDLRSRRSAVLNPSVRVKPTTQTQTTDFNTPANMALFLSKRHGKHVLFFHLSDAPPDGPTVTDLKGQIVKLPWNSPGQPASETPTVPVLLQVCYALAAWLGFGVVVEDTTTNHNNKEQEYSYTDEGQASFSTTSKGLKHKNDTVAVLYCWVRRMLSSQEILIKSMSLANTA
jgi:hypothetical protein